MVSIIFWCPLRLQRIVFGTGVVSPGGIRVVSHEHGDRCTIWNKPSPKFDKFAETLIIHSMHTALKYSTADIRYYTQA